MTEFAKSLALAASACGWISSLPMMLATVFAHMSHSSELARTASVYVSGAGFLLFAISLAGIFHIFRSGLNLSSGRGARTTRYAAASIIVGFPLFGLMTWGVSSLAGIILGIVALRKICGDENFRGRWLAISGICLSFSTLPCIIIMLLFLGA